MNNCQISHTEFFTFLIIATLCASRSCAHLTVMHRFTLLKSINSEAQCDKCVFTYWVADISVVFFCLYVGDINLLLLLGRGFSFSIVSFGVAVNMKDVCRAKCPLKMLMSRTAAAGQLRLLIAGCILRGYSHCLTFNRFKGTDVYCRHTVLLFFWRA